LIHTIAQWYLHLMQRELDELGVAYSPLRKGFVGRAVAKRPGDKPQIIFRADRYADLTELKALVTLVGPYGVRVLDKGLIGLVQFNVNAVREILREYMPTLQTMQGRFNERGFFADAVQKLNRQGFDRLVRHSVVVGCILKFRDLLREALQEVVRQRVPFIFDVVKLAHSQLPDLSQNDAKLSALDHLAQDCGIDVKEADHALRSALARFKTAPLDITLWGLLPEMYGLSFIIPRWSEAVFDINTEAHLNNAHCMVHCIHTLIALTNRIMLKGDAPPNVTDMIQIDLERFVKCAAHTILHCNMTEANYPLANVMVFIEQFITWSNGRLQLGMLEEVFPFTLLRASYIRLSQQQTSPASRSAMPLQEKEEKE